MRATALIAGVIGVAVGLGGGALLESRNAGRGAPSGTAPAGGAPDRWSECLARLEAIDARLAALAAPAGAPTRVAAEEPSVAKIADRLTAIEAALANLKTTAAAAKGREDPPRHPRDAATFDRLFEAEYAKRQERHDDHLGYTADRLYERYGAPDFIWADPKDEEKRVIWAYNDPNGSRGVTFSLRSGVVVDEGAWMN